MSESVITGLGVGLGIRILKAPQVMQSGLGTTDLDRNSSKMDMFILALSPELQGPTTKLPGHPHMETPQAPQIYHVKYQTLLAPLSHHKGSVSGKSLTFTQFSKTGASDASRILYTALWFGVGGWKQAVLMWFLCLSGVVRNRILVKLRESRSSISLSLPLPAEMPPPPPRHEPNRLQGQLAPHQRSLSSPLPPFCYHHQLIVSSLVSLAYFPKSQSIHDPLHFQNCLSKMPGRSVTSH